MDNNTNNPFKGRYNSEIFSPEFFALDFHEQDDHLTGITVGVRKNAANYVMTMATIDVYANRRVDDDYEGSDDVLVMSTDEILPSDLLSIRRSVLESNDFDRYLIEQTE